MRECLCFPRGNDFTFCLRILKTATHALMLKGKKKKSPNLAEAITARAQTENSTLEQSGLSYQAGSVWTRL